MLFFLSKQYFQHGFRNGLSTSTAIHSFYNKIVDFLDAGECPVGIFCDLTKAFDCVQFDILFDKLFEYGIRGVCLDWVSSFLLNRKQYVVIKHKDNNVLSDVTSRYLEIEMGVPQGSVLGPMLFILYINNLEKYLNNNFTMYADDLSLLVSNKCKKSLIDDCNNVLMKVSDFFNTHKLYFNTDKTTLVQFHNRQKLCDPINVNIDKDVIESTESVKFLGLCIDKHLNFKLHCKSIIGNLHRMAYLFINLRKVLTISQLMNLYYAHIESKLRYCICFWGSSPLFKNVFIAQKIFLRIIAGIDNQESCKPVFHNFSVLTLPSLYVLELSVFVFKNKSKFNLVNNVHNFNTRNNKKFYVPSTKLDVKVNSPECIGLKIFNKLPDSIKESTNIHFFKNKLKNYLLSMCLYDVSDFFLNP